MGINEHNVVHSHITFVENRIIPILQRGGTFLGGLTGSLPVISRCSSFCKWVGCIEERKKVEFQLSGLD